MKIAVWKDAKDPDSFVVGSISTISNCRYFATVLLHIDQIGDIFGDEMKQECKRLNNSVLEFDVTANQIL